MAKRKPAPRPQNRHQRRRDGANAPRPRRPESRPVVERRGKERDGRFWLYGRHAVLAALANPERRCHRLLVAERDDPELAARLEAALAKAQTPRPAPETCSRTDLEAVLPEGAVHQGLALRVSPLRPVPLEIVWADLAPDAPVRLIVLDQATDPRNVGAILRSAAAFGAAAVVVQSRHAPDESGALAKAASGALETVPLIRVTNLVRALEEMKAAGIWSVGLDGRAEGSLAAAEPGKRAALVLGSEGSGLRRLVREACDLLARIPIAPGMESLNLSNAAAVALYDLARRDA